MVSVSMLVKLQCYIGLIVFMCILYPILLVLALLHKLWRQIVEHFIGASEDDITGEVAVVTGAANGLGRAIATQLARRKCNIAVVDIDLAGAERTVEFLECTFRVRAKAYKVNVANHQEIVQLNEQVTADLGPATVLINNAGLMMLPNPLQPKAADVQRLIDVNVLSHFWTKDVFLPKMKQLRKGHIVTVSSASSFMALAYNSAYTASKFAATGHMRALRQELAYERQDNIHVCTFMPYFLRTNAEVADLANKSNFNILFPLLDGDKAAQRVVQGVLRHEREIAMPSFMGPLFKAFAMLPISWQEHITLICGRRSYEKFCAATLESKPDGQQ